MESIKQHQGQQDKSCNDRHGFPLSLLLLGTLRLFPAEESCCVSGYAGCIGLSSLHGYVDGLQGQSYTSP